MLAVVEGVYPRAQEPFKFMRRAEDSEREGPRKLVSKGKLARTTPPITSVPTQP